ncbi:hypothetical protein AAEX28_05995 [Lentisphaerota bacterium WC36G]|nr:hypothetical protein LJT99_08855 [Lentisphaerae bacterium WC36]
MRKIYGFCASFIILFAVCFFTSCTSFSEAENNNSTMIDILDHFKESGIKIEGVRPLMRKTVGAQIAMALVIAGSDVGIYKFDSKLKLQRERLEFAKKNGYIFIVGRKFEAFVNGSFVMISANSNKEKKKIIAAFKSFKQ